MKLCLFRFCKLSGSALLWLLASYPVTAQIVPDATLPTNSIVTPNGNTSTITGGTQAGGNLFHSFKEFSVLTGGTAFFNNASNIQNIITRVTGESKSNIDGLIKANGVNLFFINPNGIIFGPNASLNIGGSFVASTANSLKFADGTEFSATNPQATPLLTVSVPLGLQFGSNPGEIVNKANDPTGELSLFDSPVGLQVPEGKTLALVGGNISLEGGNLTAPGGRIELGSVGAGLVNLTAIPQGYALEYSGVQNFQDIRLSNSASVDASGVGGGSIQVKGRNINLTSGAQIYSVTVGAGTGGNLTVDAAESVNLSDNAALLTDTSSTGSAGNLTISARKLTVESGAFIETPNGGQGPAGDLLVRATDAVELSGTTTDGLPSGLSAQVAADATGKGGNLTIETGQLTIRGGAAVEASTFGTQNAGNVRVKASNVELEGYGIGPNGPFASGIFAQVADRAINNAGNAGNLTIETQGLTVLNGAQIATTGRKTGNGGDLTITSDSIRLSGALPNATPDRGSSGISVSANSPAATGNVGNLTITSRQIAVENGAKIAARNEGAGQGGTLTLNVSQLKIQNGGLVQSGSFASGPGGTLTVNNADSVDVIGIGSLGVSTLSAAAQASGKAGDLNITTRSLNVQDGAKVTVSGNGSGSAGKLTITAKDIRLNQGKLLATTNAGEGANIQLQGLDLLFLQNNSLISAQAFSNAKGGNIEIDARNGVVAAVPDENNDIVANAIQGQGGNITITTQDIFEFAQRKSTPANTTNDIDASSEFNQAGTVIINTPDVDPSRGLFALPTVVPNTPVLVASNCEVFAEDSKGSSFTVTGRGGLPPSPDEPLSSDAIWSDTRLTNINSALNQTMSTITPHRTQQTRDSSLKTLPSPIVINPATGWVFNKEKGEVTLISKVSNPTNFGSTPASCPQSSSRN
ncbi:MAG: filamentous hemagglutinin N-terminal domain-containing protein [Stigonema ocellatum SAG 48.90 = DSM 106950]|nr:filamentous hemagglutinin N-terminal domain-containing protein [Stigonema ocellatum SAG 48.90 = DSM 106950]